jgi:hypothetical protein
MPFESSMNDVSKQAARKPECSSDICVETLAHTKGLELKTFMDSGPGNMYF